MPSKGGTDSFYEVKEDLLLRLWSFFSCRKPISLQNTILYHCESIEY